MRSIFAAILQFVYGEVKQRLFPNFRLNRIFPFWDSVYTYFTSRAKSTFVEGVLGHKMFLDEQDSLELSIYKVFEPAEGRFLMNQITEGSSVVDIGANIGYYTLQFARKVGSRGHVYAFEPDPQNFILLKKNIEVNGYKNVTPVQMAVSDVSGVTRLYLSLENKGDHRIFESDESRSSVEIQSTLLDDYFRGSENKIDLIKMDVQGAEYRALMGMQGVLSRNPGIVLVTEFWPYGLIQSNADPKAYLDLLLSHGFEGGRGCDEEG
jgi:FkbM family methyltransferase